MKTLIQFSVEVIFLISIIILFIHDWITGLLVLIIVLYLWKRNRDASLELAKMVDEEIAKINKTIKEIKQFIQPEK